MYVPDFHFPFISAGHLGCFLFLAILRTEINRGERISLWWGMELSRYISRSGINRSQGTSIFIALRNVQTDFHNGRVNLYLAVNKGSSRCSSQRSFPYFLMVAVLTGVR